MSLMEVKQDLRYLTGDKNLWLVINLKVIPVVNIECVFYKYLISIQTMQVKNDN